MMFSLVSTTFNEIDRISSTISDIEQQRIYPDEIIITDAGSTDGTWEKLQEWKNSSKIPIRLIQEKKCNVARGRNLAIEAAQYDIIVSTDFGCRFHPGWLESLVTAFGNSANNSTDNSIVVGGTYTVQEETLKTMAAKANYILTDGYKLDTSSWFIPSSRSIAYHKNVWTQVGGYPEWLTLAGDDLVFGMKMKAKGYSWQIVDQPYVYWLRHQTAKGYVKESYRYGLGDGEAGVNLRNSLILVAEVMLRTFLIISLISICFGQLWATISLIISLTGFRPYLKTCKNWLHLKSGKYHFGILLNAFILLEKTRFSYLKGYFTGFLMSGSKTKQERHKLKQLLNKNE